MIIGIVSLILLNTNNSKNALKFIKLFLNFLLCSLVYDILWIVLYKDVIIYKIKQSYFFIYYRSFQFSKQKLDKKIFY